MVGAARAQGLGRTAAGAQNRGMARVGTSGWSYDHWDGVLYRPGLPARDRLARYVEAFDTVELNASFYRWPPPSSFVSWRRRLPEGFELTVKAPRGLTHARRLYGPEQWIERMTAGLHELAGRRGPLPVSYTHLTLPTNREV